jgi:hypothetical protein
MQLAMSALGHKQTWRRVIRSRPVASKAAGIWRPSDLAVLRLMTNSNFVARRSPSPHSQRFLDVFTDAVEDVTSAIDIGHDAGERFPDFTEVGRMFV